LKIAIWKKIFSYFFDISIEKKQSNFSGELEILLSRGRLALCTKNAMYSFDDLYLNFRTAFSVLNINKFNSLKAEGYTDGLYGSQAYHQGRSGLDAESISRTINDYF
jgi:hypothetical protein